MVNFPAEGIEGVEAASGVDAAVTVGNGDAELIGFGSLGLNFCAGDLNFPRCPSVCGVSPAGVADADGTGVAETAAPMGTTLR